MKAFLKSNYKRNNIRVVILIALSAVVFLLFGEFACRVFVLFKNSSGYMRASSNKELGMEYKPGIEYVNKFGVRRKLNPEGFEGPELSTVDKGALRIIFFGDSIIEGSYLPMRERLPALLEKEIYSKSGMETVVWNAGVGGYNSRQVYELIKENIAEYRPDLVIVGICLNDFVDTRPRVYTFLGRVYLIMRDGSKARFINWLYQKSELYKLTYDALNSYYRMNFIGDGYKNYLKNYRFEISEPQWGRWITCLKETHELLRQNDSCGVFVVFPLYSQLVQGDYSIQERLGRVFAQENIPFIDLSGAYKPYISQGISLYLERDIIHPNKKGFSVAAYALSGLLDQKGYLNTTRR
ncbi:MAG: SGNH/GDSL hydrolase family protein [Candidatus Omnitrophota bacterium]